LGGNAISKSDEEGNVTQQFEHSRETAAALANLIDQGHQLVITHGNGPQIGNFLLRNEAAARLIYPLPMEVAVAHVQGGMGFMIAQTLMNERASRGRPTIVTTIITTVLVDPADPEFQNPSKPIGRRLIKVEAERLAKDEGWQIREGEPGVYRRVVPSPRPQHIVEIQTLRRLVEAGELIVACGGGGVPVIRDPQTGLCGVRAVIDKDLASALLAAELGADLMMILTTVERVCINFGKPDERPIERMTVADAEQFLREGQFPSGSMGPKIQGAIEFLRASTNGHARVVVGPLERASEAMEGRVGTWIVKG
jgi:carbamate kinase